LISSIPLDAGQTVSKRMFAALFKPESKYLQRKPPSYKFNDPMSAFADFFEQTKAILL